MTYLKIMFLFFCSDFWCLEGGCVDHLISTVPQIGLTFWSNKICNITIVLLYLIIYQIIMIIRLFFSKQVEKECRTVYDTECATLQKVHEVEDDVSSCRTEYEQKCDTVVLGK